MRNAALTLVISITLVACATENARGPREPVIPDDIDGDVQVGAAAKVVSPSSGLLADAGPADANALRARYPYADLANVYRICAARGCPTARDVEIEMLESHNTRVIAEARAEQRARGEDSKSWIPEARPKPTPAWVHVTGCALDMSRTVVLIPLAPLCLLHAARRN